MSRNRMLLLVLVVVLVVAALGGWLAGSIERWLITLHGQH